MHLGVLDSSGWRGAGVGACRWRDRKGPRGGRKGSGLQSPQPSRTSPGSSPGLVIFKALGKAEAVRLQGRVGKMNQNSRKGNFLFCNTTNGTHAPGPPRSVCARKQKSRGSVGTCEPIATAELRQQARPRLCLLLACGSGSRDERRRPANSLLAGGRHLLRFIT